MINPRLKIFMSVVLCCFMFLLAPIASMAKVEEGDNKFDYGIMPCWSYIVEAESDFTITGSTATVDCWVNGDVLNATKAKVIAELQVESGTDNWIPVAIWTETMDGYEAYVHETKSVKTGNNYRVKGTFTVWEGTQAETVTLISGERRA